MPKRVVLTMTFRMRDPHVGNPAGCGARAALQPTWCDSMTKKRSFFSLFSKPSKESVASKTPRNSGHTSPSKSVQASNVPSSCRKCLGRSGAVFRGGTHCEFCAEWGEISMTRMNKYHSVIQWAGANNRKESMVKATLIHRLEIEEWHVEKICQAPVFRSMMGWEPGN